MNASAPFTGLGGLPQPDEWSGRDPVAALDMYIEALAGTLAGDRLGYRNHCQRVLLNTRALAPTLDLDPVIPALAFHDLGLWTHRTVDYIDPSVALAVEHLEAIDRHGWIGPVDAMIRWHHKQRSYRGPHAEHAEPVRRADTGDFTFGLMGAVPRHALREGREAYPNAGFHMMLLRRTIGRLLTKPWSPLPMMRW